MRTHILAILTASIALASTATINADDWPQWMGPKRDGIWRESGILERFPEGGPKIRWRVPLAGGYAGPSVARGRVFVTDYVTDGDTKPDPGKRNELTGTERVLCLDSKTGQEIWKHEYDCPYLISYPAGPRTTPTVDGDFVYTLGAEGNLKCLAFADGRVVWERDLKKDYAIEAPHWGFCSHPLIEGNRLFCIVGGEGSVAVAFDKRTGKELWKALSASEPGYSAPALITAGGTRQLLVFHAEALCSLNPESGETHWTVPLKSDFGMAIMSPRQQGDYLFACGIRNAAVLLKLASDHPAAEEVWRGTPETGLYSVCMTPLLEEGIMYGVDRQGQLRGVKLETGERLWETLVPTTGQRPANSGTAFLVKQADRHFIFSEQGDLFIARLSPSGYEELGRAHLLEPTSEAFGRLVVWSHPAFAEKAIFARNDKEIVCAELGNE